MDYICFISDWPLFKHWVLESCFSLWNSENETLVGVQFSCLFQLTGVGFNIHRSYRQNIRPIFSFLPITFPVISLHNGTISYGILCAVAISYHFHLYNTMNVLLLMCAEKKWSWLSSFSQLASNSSFWSFFLIPQVW